MDKAKVSVVMPVFNGELYVREAIESVLAQTFKNFELLIINDGSTDRTAEVISSFEDPRIRILHNPSNIGLAASRNRGIQEATGQYLAWLDCDDLSMPHRLQRQVQLLDSRAGIGVCGTWVRPIGAVEGALWRYPTDPRFIRCRMLFDNPLAISSVVLRRDLLLQHSLAHDTSFRYAEDYEFWERVSGYCEIANIPEVLTLYRLHPGQMSHGLAEVQQYFVWKIQERQLRALGAVASDEQRAIHLTIGVQWRSSGSVEFVRSAGAWLQEIARANFRTKALPHDALLAVLAERWVFLCDSVAGQGFSGWTLFRSSRISSHATWGQQARHFARAIGGGLRALLPAS